MPPARAAHLSLAARQRRTSALTAPRVLQALYILYRMAYLWDSFSRWHMTGFGFSSTVYAVCYYFLRLQAKPTYAPIAQGGQLVDGGADLDQKGFLEYVWDMLYWTMFVQLGSGFVSDLFWLLHFVPPTVAFYYLWTKVRAAPRLSYSYHAPPCGRCALTGACVCPLRCRSFIRGSRSQTRSRPILPRSARVRSRR